MSHYFDGKVREVDAALHAQLFEPVLGVVARVEELVIHDVMLLIGDREFPTDLFARAMHVIATNRASDPTEGARRTEVLRRSALIDALHRLWHEIASRKVRVRWGLLTDDPAGDLRARERHEGLEESSRG